MQHEEVLVWVGHGQVRRVVADRLGRFFPGRVIAMEQTNRLTMEVIQEGGKTVLEISSYAIDQGVSADRFTQRYLKRGV